MLSFKMDRLFKISFIFLLIIKSSITMNEIVEDLEKPYVNAFINKENKPDTLCDRPKKVKLAICAAILKQLDYKIENDIYDVPVYFEHYLNKVAAFRLPLTCVKNTLSFKFEKIEDTAQMFPCHGKHIPLRTDWNEDESFDLVYLSDGPFEDSVYVYIHIKNIKADKYVFHRLMTDIKIANLPYVNVTENEAMEDLALLKQISFNDDITQIETSFLRKFFQSKIVKKDILVLFNDPVCNLEKERRLSLCEKIFPFSSAATNKFKIDVFAYENDHSANCEENSIMFLNDEGKFNELNIKQNMFPCYFQGYQNLYISSGYKKNSILVYDWDDYFETFLIRKFIENVNFEDVKPVQLIVETAPAETHSSVMLVPAAA